MKAFTVNQYGKKESLEFAAAADPTVSKHDVLIHIYAASINPLDSKIKDGAFKLFLPYKTPFTLGHDAAGVIIRTGADVTKFKVGDEVYARPRDHRIGTFAELISINEDDVAMKPVNLSMEEAASIPLVGLTAWQALVEIAQLKEGQKVFIQAGSGGVGTFAIQLAKYVGATVATTASEKNFELVKSLGADVVIDYRKDDFEKILRNYDVVLNSQDSKTLEKSLRILKPGGKLISISGPPTPKFAAEIGAPGYLRVAMRLLSFKTRRQAKKLGVEYSFLLMKANGDQLGKITSVIEAAKIKPVIDQVFPFKLTNEALTYVESGRSKGKVVIKIQP